MAHLCRVTGIVAVVAASWAIPSAAGAAPQVGESPGSWRPAPVWAAATPALAGADAQSPGQEQAPPGKKGGKKDTDATDAAQADSKKEGAFEFVFRDRPSFRFGRAFRLDVTLLVQGEARRSMQEMDPAGETFTLTRRRLGIQGTFLNVFEYEVEKELESGGAWRDVFVNVRPVPYVQAQAGKFKMPFGREELTSPRSRDFIYRSLVMTEVAPQRAIGVMIHGRLFGPRVHYQVGVFDGDGENSPRVELPDYPLTEDDPTATGRSVAARVRVAPFSGRKGSSPLESLEVGAAVVPSTLTPGLNHLRGRTVLGLDFFPRTVYVNGTRTRLGAELSWTPGPFSLQAEYVRAEEERLGMGVGDEPGLDNDLPPLVTRGWYVAATWVLTGEKKQDGIKPRRPLLQGGFGAIELAVRHDFLGVGAGDTAATPTTSPRAADIVAASDRVETIGLNWYVNTWVKIQVNAIRERLEGPRAPFAGRSTFWSHVLRVQFSM